MKRHGDRPYLFNASRRARCPHRAAIPYAPSSARPRKLRIIRHGINAMAYSLRCSSSPQHDRWRWVTLGAPNGHLPPWVGKALRSLRRAKSSGRIISSPTLCDFLPGIARKNTYFGNYGESLSKIDGSQTADSSENVVLRRTVVQINKNSG